MKQISVNNFIITSVFFVSMNFCLSQNIDTVYVIYEDSDISQHGFGRKGEFDSLALYPYDKGRRYEITVEDRPISFFYSNSKTYEGNCIIEVTEKNIDSLRFSDVKDLSWFRHSSYDQVIREFSEQDQVILLAEKEFIKRKNVLFIKVCVYYQQKE